MMLESLLLRRQVSSTSGPTAIDDFEPDVATFLTPLRAMLTESARRGQSRDADPQAIAYWFVVVDCSRAAVPPLSLPSRCCRVHALRGGGAVVSDLAAVVVVQAQHARRRQMLEMLGTAITLLQAIR